MRPLIGLTTQHITDEEKNLMANGLGESYIAPIAAAGGAPVLIPLLNDREILRNIFERIDAVLFPGGADVHPKFYGQVPHEKLGATDEIRDEVEITLCRWAFEENKPVMGLCRGIQLMNVALGGTLIQDIPSQRGADTGHRQTPGSWTDTAHLLKLRPKSMLAETIDSESLPVNSFHHQAIDRIADSLMMVGESEDGLPEAVEATGKRFFIGLQCHPEHLWQGTDERWQKLFRAFVEAARH